jgi:hypothetical protein
VVAAGEDRLGSENAMRGMSGPLFDRQVRELDRLDRRIGRAREPRPFDSAERERTSGGEKCPVPASSRQHHKCRKLSTLHTRVN